MHPGRTLIELCTCTSLVFTILCDSYVHVPQVDSFLDRLTLVTKEEDQKTELAKIIRR